MKALCCSPDASPTKREVTKLRCICLALVDRQRYVNLISHTMREHVLMHFEPTRRCAIKKHIKLVFQSLIDEGVLRRGRGWSLIYGRFPVAYRQPWACFVWRANRRDPAPAQAMAQLQPALLPRLQLWKANGSPARDTWDEAYALSLETLGKYVRS